MSTEVKHKLVNVKFTTLKSKIKADQFNKRCLLTSQVPKKQTGKLPADHREWLGNMDKVGPEVVSKLLEEQLGFG